MPKLRERIEIVRKVIKDELGRRTLVSEASQQIEPLR
jgi:hypothetical protein